jgi:hypothetical protein
MKVVKMQNEDVCEYQITKVVTYDIWDIQDNASKCHYEDPRMMFETALDDAHYDVDIDIRKKLKVNILKPEQIEHSVNVDVEFTYLSPIPLSDDEFNEFLCDCFLLELRYGLYDYCLYEKLIPENTNGDFWFAQANAEIPGFM